MPSLMDSLLTFFHCTERRGILALGRMVHLDRNRKMDYLQGSGKDSGGSEPRKDGMADSYSSKLPIWEGWGPSLVKPPTPAASTGDRGLSVTTHPVELAEQFFALETLSQRRGSQDGAEPFSLQWFLEIEAYRYGRHGRWLPRLLEFAKHSGDRLLGVGPGLGTDWIQYARHGAEVIACCPTGEHKTMVQRNFELRGQRAQFLVGSPNALPLESSSIDVVCLGSLLQPEPNPAVLVEEIYRVLKPGGKVLALARAYYDVEFWCYRWLPWRPWLRSRPSANETARGYKASQLRRLFNRFVEHHSHKRHLRRSDVPHLWRWWPLPILERWMGKLLVLKAFKPLSAAIATPLAA
jgi:ubiquinone/menaquinone biosynthesis C-methylase UbiE